MKKMAMVAKRGVPVIFVIALIIVGTLVIFEKNLQSVFTQMAEARARALALRAIDEAVVQIFDSNLQYDDLVHIEKDAEGHVTMLQANAIAMNDLAKHCALLAQENLSNIGEMGVSLPLASALGIKMLGNFGPRVHIQFLPVGSINTKFVSEFQTAGINQTRHRILLQCETRVQIILPTNASSISVTSQIAICETIIVGMVPTTFINVQDADQMLNLVPLQ